MPEPLTTSQFLNQMMANLKGQFFGDREKEFYEDQNILKQVLTTPAAYLKARGVKLSIERQRTILLEIFLTIKRHGNTGKVLRFSVYILDCVQKHLQHHGEEYYDEAKTVRSVLADVMMGIQPKGRKPADPGDSVETLAELNRMLRGPRGGRKKAANKPVSKALQMDFLSLGNELPKR